MCGKEDKLYPVLIEGVQLNVCQKCSSFGKILKMPVQAQKKELKPAIKREQAQREIIQVIREDFPDIIRQKRERLGLKQEEFAKFLSEKESMIHKIESGTYVPPLEIARKIERQLGISLIEEKELTPQHLKEKKDTFTIGDVIKVK